jgi:hypothetical protein
MPSILLPKSRFRFDWDYVLAGYGTGAVMEFLGDERDYAFANFFKAQGMQEKKTFLLMLTFLKKPTVRKTM